MPSRSHTPPAPLCPTFNQRPPFITHHSSPSVVSLASLNSCGSLSSSSSAETTFSFEVVTPPHTPVPHLERMASQRSPQGPRPRPTITISPASSFSSRTNGIQKSAHAKTHVRSPSLPNPPFSSWQAEVPAADTEVAFLLPSPLPSPLDSPTPISGRALSFFPLPPTYEDFAQPTAVSPKGSRTPSPERSRSSSPTPIARPTLHRSDTSSSTISLSNAPPTHRRQYSSGAELPRPAQSEEDSLDWCRLEKALGTWRASRRGASREVEGILGRRVRAKGRDSISVCEMERVEAPIASEETSST